MDLLAIAAVLAVLIVLVVVIIKRSASKKETPVLESEKPPVDISRFSDYAEPEPEEEGPEKVTIYTYARPGRIKVCAFCDGENDITATYCCICGKQTDG